MTETEKKLPLVQQVVSILWPSFLTAGAATILFFTAFDPQLIMEVSGYGEISRLGGYSMGFFLFWMLTSTSCALTCYFRKPCDELGKKNQ
ncbi:MAG: hypothetical protein OEZ39_00175 [Gammaproteobacteria bacterium]|nr:hypothetical protein [Gammaproteobacteria bacterium]MDH5650263.1 hypothetical protein [Gammaproteobacteria bacterium]